MRNEVSVVGHRGWPVRFPDNTLPGFLAAAPICDAIELDVRRSADGKLALAHDPQIGGSVVHSTQWAVLADIDVGGGAKPCLLDEALAALPETPVFIEIKNEPGNDGYEFDSRIALEAADRARPKDVIISFNWASIDVVRRHFPDVATGLNVGVLGDLGDAIEHSLVGGHAYLVPDVELFDQFDAVVPEELQVYVWAAKRGETFGSSLHELVSRNVSGIITDDPEATRNLLRSMI